MKIEISKPEIIRIAYLPDREDRNYSACTWAYYDFSPEKGLLNITGDCGNCSYQWPEKGLQFWKLMASVKNDYLMGKFFRDSEKRFCKQETLDRLEEYFEECEYDPDQAEEWLDELEDKLDEYELEDCLPLAEFLVDEWNDENDIGIDCAYELVVSDYTPHQKRIVKIFLEYIQPKIKEAIREGAPWITTGT